MDLSSVSNILLLCKCSPLFQVCACAEARVYFTGQDQRPGWPVVAFVMDAVDLVAQLGEQLLGYRIARGWPVQ